MINNFQLPRASHTRSTSRNPNAEQIQKARFCFHLSVAFFILYPKTKTQLIHALFPLSSIVSKHSTNYTTYNRPSPFFNLPTPGSHTIRSSKHPSKNKTRWHKHMQTPTTLPLQPPQRAIVISQHRSAKTTTIPHRSRIQNMSLKVRIPESTLHSHTPCYAFTPTLSELRASQAGKLANSTSDCISAISFNRVSDSTEKRKKKLFATLHNAVISHRIDSATHFNFILQN